MYILKEYLFFYGKISIFTCMRLKDVAKERKIMDTSLEIVYSKGLAGLKMSEIANKVQISPSNLYIYFKNKEDLVVSTFFETIRGLVKHFEDYTPDHLIFKKRVFEVYKLLIQIKINKRREFSFINQFLQSPYFKREYVQEIDIITRNVFDIFKAGQKNMILKDHVEVKLIFALVDGTTTKLVDLHNTGKIKLTDKMTEDSFALVWDAIRQ